MKKYVRILMLMLAVLLLFVSAAAAQQGEVIVSEFIRCDLSDVSEVELFASEPWGADDTCYGDRLTGYSAGMYQNLCELFDSTYVSKTGENINRQVWTVEVDTDGDGQADGTENVPCWAADNMDAIIIPISEYTGAWANAFFQEIFKAMYAFTLDHPEYFWIRTDVTAGLTAYSTDNIHYNVVPAMGYVCQPMTDTEEKIEGYASEIQTVTNAILAETKTASILQKLEYLDQWIVANNHYNTEAANKNLNGYGSETPWSLVGGLCADASPVCEGYAKAFQYLCHKIDIPCVVVSGYGKGVAHMWNAVKLGGQWYMTDSCWNDPVYSDGSVNATSTKEFFLASMPVSHVEWMNFLSGPQIADSPFSGTLVEQLPEPTQMKWNTENEDGIAIPGMISWSGSAVQQSVSYKLNVYRAAGRQDEWVCGAVYEAVNGQVDFTSTKLLEAGNLKAGSYYFTVQAVGDPAVYQDSSVAKSETLSVALAKQDGRVKDPIWEGLQISWYYRNRNPKQIYLYQYEIVQMMNDGSKETVCIGFNRERRMNSMEILQWLCSSGTYAVRVRPIYWENNVVSYGLWSGYSDSYQLSSGTIHANEVVRRIVEKNLAAGKSAAEIRSLILEELTAEELLEAMRADTCGHCILDSLAALDSKASTKLGIDSKLEAMPEGRITVVGAGLNAASGSRSVTLKVGEPERSHAEENYSNMVAFSMELEGAAQTADHKLQVPVQITLPVPAQVNPLYLAVLHYAAGSDTPEVIVPHVYQDEETGLWYATFTVDSFSDFAMVDHMVAKKVSNGVKLNIQLTEHQFSQLICAVYNQDGKMLAVETIGLEKEIVEHTVQCQNPAYVKLMVADDEYAPLFQMEQIPVK